MLFAAVFRTLSLVGPITNVDRIRNLMERSKEVFPFTESPEYTSVFYWLLLHEITVGHFITCAFLYRIFTNVESVPVYHSPKISLSAYHVGFLGLKWLNGEHIHANIVSYSYFLGLIAGLGFVAATAKLMTGVSFFLGFLSLFHILEYQTTALYQQNVTLNGI